MQLPSPTRFSWSLLRSQLRAFRWKRWGLLALMLSAVGMLLVGLIAWQNPAINQTQLRIGQVAPFDIIAPQQFTFESEVLTERSRQRAAESVPDQYEFNESEVRREQVTHLRQTVEYISAIRDTFPTSPTQAIRSLTSVAELELTSPVARMILELSPEAWTSVVAEAPVVLDRMMREEIRESTLSTVRQRVPMMISGDMDDPVSKVITLLVRAHLRSNSLYNEARTLEMRQIARNGVQPQTRTYERSEAIIRAGDRADAEAVEALAQLRQMQQQWDRWTVSQALCFAALILTLIVTGIAQLHPTTATNYQELALLLLIGTLWLLTAKFMISSYPWLAYFYPLGALAILISILISEPLGILFTIIFALIAHFFGAGNPILVIYLTAGALIGALTIERAEQLNSFLWAGALMAITNLAALLAFRSASDGALSNQFLQVVSVAVTNGFLSSGIALIGYFLLGHLFGITTSLQLGELSRPTHPLLRQLQLKAPGTYFHTILVSNMAERAATAIGADGLVTRVGAYYHDIGKSVRPYFFTENIIDGPSPHERLDPTVSAQIIISHVTDGLGLAQKYRVPERIQEFIREHHGRSLVRYFYARAVNERTEDETVNEADFRYPGPNPRSKETGILMLADTCEATVRARHPANREELTTIIHQIVGDRITAGELNDSNLTLNELQTIREVFVQVLEGVHHPRIPYPEINKKPAEAPTLAPVSSTSASPTITERLPVLNGVELAVLPEPQRRNGEAVILPIDEVA